MDRVSLLEVWSVLAADYGLYTIYERLHQIGFRPSPLLSFDSLDEEQVAHYKSLVKRASCTNPYALRLVTTECAEDLTEQGPTI